MSQPIHPHPVLDSFSDYLLRCGKWHRWCAADDRLHGLGSLDEAVARWRRDRSAAGYLVVAALAAIGSTRGGHDDDAAIATVVLLGDGVGRLSRQLEDRGGRDDVVAALWEEVKRSAPNLGARAPQLLLARTKSRVLGTTLPRVGADGTLSLEVVAHELDGPTAAVGTWPRPVAVAGPDAEPGSTQSYAELADLLDWARAAGVLGAPEVDLLCELVSADERQEKAQDAIGRRLGVSRRTVRRRRNAAIARLRDVAGLYLAETA